MSPLSNKRLVLFIIFILSLIQLAFLTAITGNLSYITSNISVILLLAALYLERNESTKYVVVLAAAFIGVNAFLSILSNPSSFLTLMNLMRIIYVAGVIFFAVSYYKSSIFDKKSKLIITLLMAISILNFSINVINLVPLLMANFNLTQILYISYPFVQVSILIYLWIKDTYNY